MIGVGGLRRYTKKMSADRIPCLQCDSMILEATAKRNGGLCAPCKRRRDCEAREAQRDEYRKNPPKTQQEINQILPDTIANLGLKIFLGGLLPRKFDPAMFTKKRFVQALEDLVSEYDPDGAKISREFLRLCDPIIHQSDSLTRGLKRLPRPYREAMAVYQLWGMMMGDGISSYLESTDRKVDSEVDRGLRLLGRTKSLGKVEQVRSSFDPIEGVPEELEESIERIFYDDLDEFEANILGEFLIKQTKKA
jgi:hypothetical protein